jgi:ATP-dependent protease ClpP protease subunit
MSEEKKFKLDHKLKIKSEDLVWHMHEYDVDVKSNHIYLFGAETYASGVLGDTDKEPGIEYVITNRFIRNLNLCMRANPGDPILVHMKTCGGYWTEGISIYDAIKSCPSPVTILNYTHARSMSSLILQAANKRVMMPNSYFMFHQGTDGIEGSVKSVESYVDFNKNSTRTMLDIYVKSMKSYGKMKGWAEKKIEKWLIEQMNKKEEVYLTAEEAVAYGFADEVFNYNWSKLTDYAGEQLRDK